MPLKLIWRVCPESTGKYRSFHRRGWPTAYYPGEGAKPAVFLSCADEYRPSRVREGAHGPITITVLHHNHPESPNSWKQFNLKKQGATLDEAKAIALAFLTDRINWHPKET